MLQLSIPLQAGSLEDEIDKKYQKAYNLVLDEKWEQAIKEFQSLLDKYPRSAWADDAQYWACFALEKLEASLEDAFLCYQEFIKDYPNSEWRDEAKSEMIQIAKKLEKQGQKDYVLRIESMQESEDEEVVFAALMALMTSGDVKAQNAVIEFFDTSKNDKLRKKALYVLGTMESEKATEKLMEIAKKDKNIELRKDAIFWLGQK